MRNILLVFSLLFCLCNECLAAPFNKTIIEETLLDNNPTSVTSSVVLSQNLKDISFVIEYDETGKVNLEATVTLFVSYDGTNFLQSSFYDYAGGTTLQTSQTITSDERYLFWFNNQLNAPYIKVVVAGSNTGAVDTIAIIGRISAEQQ